MTALLDNIKSTGVEGVMIETPATPLDVLMDYFADSIIIGGIDTIELTFGTPDSVRRHVMDICRRTADMSGFVMSSSGGIHGNIPLENLEAYFDARVETGFTPSGWRNL
jgi:uroporphyrinogen-III decarboxylase